VFHCPFCHGWEVRERPLGVLEGGGTGVERAVLLSAWSDDVTLLTNGPAEIERAEAERLERAGIAIDERPIRGLRGPGSELEAVEFADGDERPLGGLLVAARLHQRSDLARQLGATFVAPGPMLEDAIEVQPMLLEAAPGLYAAGDVLPRPQTVANAVASGAAAGMMIVRSLTTADG
jgi:thioredoxin reductase